MTRQSAFDSAVNSQWLTFGGKAMLRLDRCSSPHEIFERVLLNVSASGNVAWRAVANARARSPRLYGMLMVCAVLIDEHLESVFFLNERQRSSLMGPQMSQALSKFRQSHQNIC